MKKITELFTPEQQELLKNVYIIINNSVMIPIAEENNPTRDTLRVIATDFEGGAVVLEAEDFEYYADDDHDFRYYLDEGDDYASRDNTPEEVRDILDAVIKEKMADEEENKESAK